MDPLTMSLTFLVGCLGIFYYFRYSFGHFKRLGLPSASAVPILGSMWPFVFRLTPVVDLLVDAYNKYPEMKYIGFYDFSSPVFVIKDLEVIKSIAVKNFDSFPNHMPVVDPELDEIFANNLFSLQDDKWRQMRNLLTPAFTSSKMKYMFKLMSKCAAKFADHIALEQKDKPGNKEVDMKTILTKYTNDVIATCAFGIDVDTMKDPKNDFYVLGRKATNFDALMSAKFFLMRIAPWLCKLLDVKLMDERVKKFFTSVVGSTVATRDEKGITRPDMIQLMMEARDKNEDLDIRQMTSQAFIFFFGGFDTSSSVMCFAAHEIAVNPEVHERLQAEVDEVFKESHGDPTYEAINSMEYLSAVLNETLRVYPVAPMVDRVCVKEFELPPATPGMKPVTLYPGSRVWFPVYAIQRDPKYYPNPGKFDPERFLGEDKLNVNNSTVYLPFGLGPRMCIGNRFALLECKVLLFHLLARCNLKPSSKTCIPMEFSAKAFAMLPRTGFWLNLEPRRKTYLSPDSQSHS
ncbi:cytochrome P450 9e2-like [Orussus abietinus]|uniref:cytochrome P450 9e2-like n=1 Tax=Orussus abietinus TaxID=222816 RepID=UPI00062597E5|nr:cytochrome P450 9e2-like [Orussus abietinus]